MDPHRLRFANVAAGLFGSALETRPLGMAGTDRLTGARAGATAQPLLRVRVDLLKLRENLSAEWRRRLSSREVFDFLTRAGFREAPDGGEWLAPEPVLMRLDPSEVVSAEPLRGCSAGVEPNRN